MEAVSSEGPGRPRQDNTPDWFPVSIEAPTFILTPLHRTVIRLSQIDPAFSVKQPGWAARWFGKRKSNPLALADPKLEALRRYGILRRIRGSALPRCEREKLCSAGYAEALIDEIDQLVLANSSRP